MTKSRSRRRTARATRHPRLMAAGAVALLIGLIGSALAWHAATAAQSVMVMTRDVVAGETLTREDVETRQLRLGAGVATWPLDQPVDGQVVMVDLAQGTVLVPAAVGQPAEFPEGTVRAPVVVGVGLAPVQALAVGGVVALCGPDGETITATVASVPVLLPDAGRHRFDVWVLPGDAPLLARWVADGTLVVAAI